MGKTPDLASLDALKAGITGLQRSLTALGVSSAYQLADGSGLSRQNQASPRIFVGTLQAMHRSAQADSYIASLSKAGVSGTLTGRFKHTPVQGQFVGKTGSLRAVAALSGYLQEPALAVSILANAPTSTPEIQPQIDAIIQILKRWGSC